MSSTEPAFFLQSLLPLSAQAKAAPLFPTFPDPRSASYFERPARTMLHRVDFELPGLEHPDALAGALVRLWTEAGHPELAVLAEGLSRISQAQGNPEQPEGDVSEFIYAMF